METPFFSALDFKTRDAHQSLRAEAFYSNGTHVSVTIGPSTLCESMRTPYELCFLWTPDYRQRDEPIYNLTAYEVDQLIAEAVALPLSAPKGKKP